jgi:hypothetical protein
VTEVLSTSLAPNELLALRAYAAGRRADLTATELGAARATLAAAGLVRDCSYRTNRMYVTPTAKGRALLARLDLPPMTAEAAAWVYDTALTPTYRRSCTVDGDPALILRCSCQGGRCGHCAADRHHQCTTRLRGPVVGTETYIVSVSGGAYTPVWLAGRPCRWVCPCDCPAPEPIVVAVPEFEQLDLFALAGGA